MKHHEGGLWEQKCTFLGVKIRASLKLTSHVEHLCGKIRAAAGRIRLDGRHLRISDKRTLYFAWIQGMVQANGLAYLPNLNKTEMLELQTACNAGIRSIISLPRYGYAEISALRRQLKIPSISGLKDCICSIAAWKKFSNPANDFSDYPGPYHARKMEQKHSTSGLARACGKNFICLSHQSMEFITATHKKFGFFKHCKMSCKKSIHIISLHHSSILIIPY